MANEMSISMEIIKTKWAFNTTSLGLTSMMVAPAQIVFITTTHLGPTTAEESPRGTPASLYFVKVMHGTTEAMSGATPSATAGVLSESCSPKPWLSAAAMSDIRINGICFIVAYFIFLISFFICPRISIWYQNRENRRHLAKNGDTSSKLDTEDADSDESRRSRTIMPLSDKDK